MPSFKNRAGERYGRLTVLPEFERRLTHHRRPRPSIFWKCLCDCGNIVFADGTHLTDGCTQSCGCIRKEIGYARKTHGLSGTKEHNTWQRMKQRCYNPQDPRFESYGGRGITVCDRWRESFDLFLQDMGIAPSAKHSIDRIDNNGSYNPSNCRWATTKEQCRNQLRNRLLTNDEITMPVVQWSERTGIPSIVIRTRIDKLGWSVHDALTIPVDITKRHKHL